jgi:very-short-patch-repair endonuclease
MNEGGFNILRFANDEVVANIDAVIETLMFWCMA